MRFNLSLRSKRRSLQHVSTWPASGELIAFCADREGDAWRVRSSAARLDTESKRFLFRYHELFESAVRTGIFAFD